MKKILKTRFRKPPTKQVFEKCSIAFRSMSISLETNRDLKGITLSKVSPPKSTGSTVYFTEEETCTNEVPKTHKIRYLHVYIRINGCTKTNKKDNVNIQSMHWK